MSLSRAVALHDRAEDLLARGRFAPAKTDCLGSLRILKRIEGPRHPGVANVLNTLGRIQEGQCAYADAEKSYRLSVRIMAGWRGDGDIERIRVQSVCDEINHERDGDMHPPNASAASHD